MAKTVVGSFDDFEEAQRVAAALEAAGFSRSDISIMGNNSGGRHAPGTSSSTTDTAKAAESTASGAGTGAVAGAVIGGGAGLAASLMGLAIPGVGPILAAGPIAAVLAGAGVGAVAGGVIGALTHVGVSEDDAHYYAEAVRRGGALVTLSADDTRAEQAAEIMRSHGAIDIERRAENWRQSGWQRFDDGAAPLTTEDIERERMAWRSTAGTTTAGAGAGWGSTPPGSTARTEREHAAASGTRRNESIGDKVERAIPGDSDRDGR
jgi:hypothetical protein